MEKIELKPCPFCGGEAKISKADCEYGGQNGLAEKRVKYRICVICNKCYSRGEPVKSQWVVKDSGNSIKETDKILLTLATDRAVRRWNNRADEREG